jgi:hypothetical protein
MVKNSYDLVIGESVGPIRFGESRKSIIQKIGEPESTRITDLSIEEWYKKIGLYLEYRPSDEVCKQVSVMSPAELIYEGRDLLRMTWLEITRWLARLDPAAERVYEGWESETLGIAIHPNVNNIETYRRADFINVFNQQYRATEEELEADMQRRERESPSDEECSRLLWGQFE